MRKQKQVVTVKKKNDKFGERAQGLREPDALREDLTLVPRIHNAAHIVALKDPMPFSGYHSMGTKRTVVHIYSCR